MNDSNSASADRTTWWQAALLVGGMTDADRRNNFLFSTWCLVSAIGFCAVAFLLAFYPQLAGPFAWVLAMIIAVVPMMIGWAVGALLVASRYR